MEEANWYVVHTYSGYEKKVKANIEKSIQNLHLEDQILEVSVPVQEVVEVKDGKRKVSEKKLFPGYVLLHMIMNNETWYVVRNTRGVTGFVGPESKPVPLTEREMIPLGIKPAHFEIDFGVGDQIEVISGIWQGTVGYVKSMDHKRSVASVGVDMFGRETNVDINFLEIKKI